MFTRFTRLPLKRCLHTASRSAPAVPRFNRTAKLALGTSAAAAALLSWNLTSERSRVYLDSAEPLAEKEPVVKNTAAESEKTESEGETSGEAAKSQGAYNPETGEINWDCPCLGGMAYGPCGEQFKEAFSCFIFSEEEPKGINCVDAFKKMQDCFREHPEVYADEIMADDDEEPARPSAPAPTPSTEAPSTPAEEPATDASASTESPSKHKTGSRRLRVL